MKELLIVVGLAILITLLIVLIAVVIQLPIASAQVSFFNEEMGTNYSTLEWFVNSKTIRNTVVGDKVRLEKSE